MSANESGTTFGDAVFDDSGFGDALYAIGVFDDAFGDACV
jgi:hypothetical protein